MKKKAATVRPVGKTSDTFRPYRMAVQRDQVRKGYPPPTVRLTFVVAGMEGVRPERELAFLLNPNDIDMMAKALALSSETMELDVHTIRSYTR